MRKKRGELPKTKSGIGEEAINGVKRVEEAEKKLLMEVKWSIKLDITRGHLLLTRYLAIWSSQTQKTHSTLSATAKVFK